MACKKSPNAELDTSPKHDVALDTSPIHNVAPEMTLSLDMYMTAYTWVHVYRTSDISHQEFHKENDKSNRKS